MEGWAVLGPEGPRTVAKHPPAPGSPEAGYILRRFCQQLLWEETQEICQHARQVCDTTREIRAEIWLRRKAREMELGRRLRDDGTGEG